MHVHVIVSFSFVGRRQIREEEDALQYESNANGVMGGGHPDRRNDGSAGGRDGRQGASAVLFAGSQGFQLFGWRNL
jgi:hypothetical protein